jgi:ketosteroid isomerase-like protein
VTEPEDARHLRLVQQFGDAWDAGDVDKLMSLLTDDCVYSASVGPEPGTTYTGKEAVREGFVTMLALDAGGESRSGRSFVAGNLAVSEWSYLFRAGAGTDFEIRGCDIFEFRSGRISRKDAFRKSFPAPDKEVSNNVKPADGD